MHDIIKNSLTLQEDQACQYSYSADQQHGDDTSNNIIASATVDIICQSGQISFFAIVKKLYSELSSINALIHAVGNFNGSVAKRFCMEISDAQIEGTVVGDDPAKANE